MAKKFRQVLLIILLSGLLANTVSVLAQDVNVLENGQRNSEYREVSSKPTQSNFQLSLLSESVLDTSLKKVSIHSEPLYTKGSSNTVCWDKIEKSHGYGVQWALNSSFTVEDSIALVPLYADRYWVSSLKNDSTYYYRVRWYYEDGATYSAWSDTVFSTQDTMPPNIDGVKIPERDSLGWCNKSTIHISFNATDPAGIDSVCLYIRPYGRGDWLDTCYDCYSFFNSDTTGLPGPTPVDSTFRVELSDGHYEFYIGGKDAAYNPESHGPDFWKVDGNKKVPTLSDAPHDSVKIDTQKPMSEVIIDPCYDTTRFEIHYHANDPKKNNFESGIDSACLFCSYRVHPDSSYVFKDSLYNCYSHNCTSLVKGFFDFDAKQGNGLYEFYTVATDCAGNADTALARATTVDTTKPVIEWVRAQVSSDDTTKVPKDWQNLDADPYFFWNDPENISGNPFFVVIRPDSTHSAIRPDSTHSIDTSDCSTYDTITVDTFYQTPHLGEGEHWFHVLARSGAGSESEQPTDSSRYRIRYDISPPVVVEPLSFQGKTDTSIVVRATYMDSLEGTVEYDFFIFDGVVDSSGWQSGNSHNFTGLTPNTKYRLFVKVRDGVIPESNITVSDTDTTYTLPIFPDVEDSLNPAGIPQVDSIFKFTSIALDSSEIDHYHYKWNIMLADTAEESDSSWTKDKDTLKVVAEKEQINYYLHVVSHNPDNEAGGDTAYGPYIWNVQLPTIDSIKVYTDSSLKLTLPEEWQNIDDTPYFVWWATNAASFQIAITHELAAPEEYETTIVDTFFSVKKPLGEGEHYFHIRPLSPSDRVGADTTYAIRYDITAPGSKVGPLSKYQRESPFRVSYAAHDTLKGQVFHSGLDSLWLWYIYSESDTLSDTVVHYHKGESSVDSSFSFSADRNGKYEFFTVARDIAGNEEAIPETLDTFTFVDTRPPVIVSISVRDTTTAAEDSAESGWTNQRTIFVDLFGVDDPDLDNYSSGMDSIVFGEDSTFTVNRTLIDYDPSRERYLFTLSPEEGEKKVYCAVIDSAGNRSDSLTTTIALDKHIPRVDSLKLFDYSDLSEDITDSVTVKVEVWASDGLYASVPFMALYEDSTDYPDSLIWGPFRSDTTFTFSDSIYGMKTLWCAVKDSAGNISDSVSDSIELVPPNSVEIVTIFDITDSTDSTYTDSTRVGVCIKRNGVVDSVALSENSALLNSFFPFTPSEGDSSIMCTTYDFQDTTNEPKWLYCRGKNRAGQESPVDSATIILDTEDPEVFGFTLRDTTTTPLDSAYSGWTNDRWVRASIDSASDNLSGIDRLKIWGNMETIDTTYVDSILIQLTEGDGKKKVVCSVSDSAGNWSKSDTAFITLDTDTCKIDSFVLRDYDCGSEERTDSSLVKVHTAISDSFGVGFMALFEDSTWYPDRLDRLWAPFTPDTTYDFEERQDPYTLYCAIRDSAGNLSKLASDTIPHSEVDIDFTLFDFNDGEDSLYTDSTTVWVKLSPAGSPTHIAFSEDSTTLSPPDSITSWWPYPEDNDTTFVLSDGEGLKTVYCVVKDNVTHDYSGIKSAAITLDLTPPTIEEPGLTLSDTSIVDIAYSGWTNDQWVWAVVRANDALSGIETTSFSGDIDSIKSISKDSVLVRLTKPDTIDTVFCEIRDKAGNSIRDTAEIKFDSTKPLLYGIDIPDSVTADRNIWVYVDSVTDAGDKDRISRIRLSEDSTFAYTLNPFVYTDTTTIDTVYQDSVLFKLSSDYELKWVYCQVRDKAGNWSNTAYDSISYIERTFLDNISIKDTTSVSNVLASALAGWTNDDTVLVILYYHGGRPDSIRISEDSSFTDHTGYYLWRGNSDTGSVKFRIQTYPGEHIIYAQLKRGNEWTESKNDTLLYDDSQPEIEDIKLYNIDPADSVFVGYTDSSLIGIDYRGVKDSIGLNAILISADSTFSDSVVITEPDPQGSLIFNLGHTIDDGMKYVYLAVRDSAGNFVSVKDSIFLDRTPPATVALEAAQSRIDVKLTWNKVGDRPEGGVGLKKYYIYRNDSPIDSVSAESVTYLDTSAKADSSWYNYQVLPVDSLGNLQREGGRASIHYEAPPSAPEIMKEPSFTAGDSNQICWMPKKIKKIKTFIVQCATDSSFENIVVDTTATPPDTCFIFRNLEDGVEYFYRIRAKDTFGNITNWSDIVWSTQDATPPQITEMRILFDDKHDRLKWVFNRNLQIQLKACDTPPGEIWAYQIVENGQEMPKESLPHLARVHILISYKMVTLEKEEAVIELTVFDGTENLSNTVSDTVVFDSKEDPISSFPNPFSPQKGEKATIRISDYKDEELEVKIYDVFGNLVATLIKEAGKNDVEWNGRNRNGDGDIVANGGYICVVKGLKWKIAVLK